MAPRIAWQLYCLYVVHITHSSTLSPSHSLSLPLTHSLTHSVTHSLTHSFIHSLIHSSTSLTHSLTHSCLLTLSLSHSYHSLNYQNSSVILNLIMHSSTSCSLLSKQGDTEDNPFPVDSPLYFSLQEGKKS